MPKVEKLLQALPNQPRRQRTAQETKGRLVVYFITQDRSTSVRLDHVAVTPTSKRAFDLNIFKNMGRFINSVLCNPPQFDRPKNFGLDNRPRAYF
jgi:hypothetical protein